MQLRGNSVEEIEAVAQRWNDCGRAAAGLKLYSHNHAGEFAPTTDDPSRRRLDVFLANTDPSLVFWELDVFWACQGAAQYPGFRASTASSPASSRRAPRRTSSPASPCRPTSSTASSSTSRPTTRTARAVFEGSVAA